jgi:hypothetical protein
MSVLSRGPTVKVKSSMGQWKVEGVIGGIKDIRKAAQALK